METTVVFTDRTCGVCAKDHVDLVTAEFLPDEVKRSICHDCAQTYVQTYEEHFKDSGYPEDD